MALIDLSAFEWTLWCWRPFAWRLAGNPEATEGLRPDLGPFKAKVPGSVQQALLEAGALPDWSVGVNSRACEWVEHRHWEFTAAVPAGTTHPGEPIGLDAQGLDYSGWILVDRKEVARFEGALMPHRFDLTESLGDGRAHTLTVMFEEPPREQGQLGYTSRSRYFKPRYHYSWDWCARVVSIGPWDALTLKTGAALSLNLRSVRTTLVQDNRTGVVDIALDLDAEPGAGAVLAAALKDGPREVGHASVPLVRGTNPLALRDLRVEPWWPNGHGNPRMYTLELSARAAGGAAFWSATHAVGFKRVEWAPCEGAPADAEPWLCVVNGKPIFLQGANWVPPRAAYHDATADEYLTLIDLYAEIGANLLRVWGGAILEMETFYDLCDRAGILVWQEFPLSSSGVDNWPPEDEGTISRRLKRLPRPTYSAGRIMCLCFCGAGATNFTARRRAPRRAARSP